MSEDIKSKTWFVDLDGTVLKHKSNDEIDEILEKENSHEYEEFLPGALEFWKNRPAGDKIIITTARLKCHTEHTLKVLDSHGFPYDDYIFEIGSGVRVVVNDIKPIGSAGNTEPVYTAHCVNLDRDSDYTKLNKEAFDIDIYHSKKTITKIYNPELVTSMHY